MREITSEREGLKMDVETAKIEVKSLTDELELRVEELREIKKEMSTNKDQSNSLFQNNKRKYEDQIEYLEAKCQTLEKDFIRSKKNTVGELNVREILQKRQENYIDTLKKELVLAKNIIRHPRLFSAVHKKVSEQSSKFPFKEAFEEGGIGVYPRMAKSIGANTLNHSLNQSVDVSRSCTRPNTQQVFRRLFVGGKLNSVNTQHVVVGGGTPKHHMRYHSLNASPQINRYGVT